MERETISKARWCPYSCANDRYPDFTRHPSRRFALCRIHLLELSHVRTPYSFMGILRRLSLIRQQSKSLTSIHIGFNFGYSLPWRPIEPRVHGNNNQARICTSFLATSIPSTPSSQQALLPPAYYSQSLTSAEAVEVRPSTEHAVYKKKKKKTTALFTVKDSSYWHALAIRVISR